MAGELSPTTKVSLGWLLTAIALAFSIGGTATLGLAKASTAHEKTVAHEQELHVHDKRIQRVEDAVVYLKQLAEKEQKKAVAGADQ